MEYGAVAQAAEKRTEEDLAAIKSRLDAMLAAPQVEAYTREDEAFHYSIYLATHNALIIEAYSAVRPRIFRVLSFLNRHKGAKGISGNFHYQLYECIVNRTPEQAIRIIRTHDEYNRARVAEYEKLAGKKE